MNVFYLDTDPIQCARYHYDTHVVKMILESAQLLSTAHHLCGDGGPYKLTHKNHPSAIWTRESNAHYTWLYALMISLGHEYTHRFGKIHKTINDHAEFLRSVPKDVGANGWKQPPQAMPEHCRSPDSVTAYRNYYATEKINLLRYTNRGTPQWILNKLGTTNSTSI